MLTVPRHSGMASPIVLSRNAGEIPMWYKRAGNYSPLPPPLACNKRPRAAPEYTNDRVTIPLARLRQIDPRVAQAPPKGPGPWFFVWAARPRQLQDTRVYGPATSYGDYGNSALARASDDTVTFSFASPVPYVVDGVLYPPHIHFTQLLPDGTWDTRIWSINVPPILTSRDTVHRMLASRRYLGINALPSSASDHMIPGTLRVAHTLPLESIAQRLRQQRVPSTTPLVLYCMKPECNASHHLMEKLLHLGFPNLLLYPGGLHDWFASDRSRE